MLQSSILKKEAENVWNSHLKDENLSLNVETPLMSKLSTEVTSATQSIPVTKVDLAVVEEVSSEERGQGAAGSKNQSSENQITQAPSKNQQQPPQPLPQPLSILPMSPPPQLPQEQQSQKNSTQTKEATSCKKLGSGEVQNTLVQGSSLIANSGVESSNNNETNREKISKEKNNKNTGSHRGGRRENNRYESTSVRGGGRGSNRGNTGSYPLYRGRGSGNRGNDYRRGSSRGGHPPRFQNRNYRHDDYYYEYYPPRKDIGQDQNRYGGGGWGRRGRGQGNQTGRTGSSNLEVPGLMDTEIRKQPNNRFERMPPRFQKKREQEQYASGKRERGTGGSSGGHHQGCPGVVKGASTISSSSSSQTTGKTKENSPEVTEDADWETASENSDPDRLKDSKDKGKDRKYVRQDKKSVGNWQNVNVSSNKNPNLSNMSHNKEKNHKQYDAKKHASKQDKLKPGSNILKTGKPNEDENEAKNSCGIPTSSMLSKMKQDKSNTLEGIDLNNFASVVIVDNQPQVSEMIDDLLDSDTGFQEVTRKKGGREKHRSIDDRANGTISPPTQDTLVGLQSHNKKHKDKKKNKNSGYEKSRQNKLPPRFAKKRENKGKGDGGDIHSGSFFKEANIAPPPPKNAWERPLTATLRTNSPQQHNVMQDVLITNIETAQENHDSGVEVSDPPNSTGSSQRSSPSDNPVFSRQDKGISNISGSSRQDKTISSPSLSYTCVDKSVLDGSSVPSQTIIFENTNFKAAGTVTVGAEYKVKFGNDLPKPQRQQNRDRKTHSPESNLGTREELEKREKPEPIELPLSFSKADENAADMKLDFTFDQELAELSAEKSGRPIVSSLPRSSLALTSPASPSTHDLNLKIQSVKKVWDTMTPLPEHQEDPVSSSSFSTSNFSGVEKVSSLDHSSGLESFTSKEPVGVEETSEVGYQTGSPMQQGSSMTAAAAVAMVYTSSAASLAKAEVSRSGNVCKVKPQQQAACSNTSISPVLSGNSISPPLPSAGHSSSSMYLGGTAAFGGIGGAIPSPPTVMFNSSQQLPHQTGLFQPLFDGATVLGQRGTSQFSQYPYGIGQGLGSSAFGQQSMFLQTPPPLSAPADPYSNSLSQYRLQPNAVTGFGQNQPQPQSQNTVLISSASTTLMSSAVKPSTHTFGSSQQNFGTIGSKAGTPFQQSGLGGALQGGTLQGSALQGGPQPSVYIFDASQSMGLLNSQLVQRPGVQSSVIQAIQTPSSFYSSNGAGAPGGPTAPPGGPTGPQQAAAAGYFTASGSPLQAAVQQQAQPPLQTPTFGLQGFGSQSGPGTVGVQNYGSGINLTAQQVVAQTFRNNPATFLKSLQAGCTMPDVTRQQIKSPGSAHNSFGSSYFPNPSASVGTALNHCGGNSATSSQNGSISVSSGCSSANMNLNSGMNPNAVSSVQNPNQVSSPKSQNRKIGGQPVNPSNHRTGGYNPQVAGQMSSNGSLRNNMVIGMRSQLGMTCQNGLGSGPSQQRFSCPGPIQRPPSSQNTVAGGITSATSNPVHRPSRSHPHQSSSALHSAAAAAAVAAQQRTSNPSAQQAKLRADALSSSQGFFGRDGISL
ncbi:hypothetical protein Anas_14128 [Armadillidium nasatum]|uniref:Protein PRRC2A n=2 Tax=Armadillidium nasatum TaxID=96803 RepID=A0A5N5SZ63_9CRUS|nr:hypothetical protein Anas_14128 [Armadillidium nasatum]